ncbi:MAG: alpha-amylase family glycosyl hydrolase [Saprospiraceae bacterium]
MTRNVVLTLGILFSFYSCEQDVSLVTESAHDLPLPRWAEAAVMYEVNTRNITAEGTFNAFKSHLPRLKSLGIDIVLMTPIHPISLKKRKTQNKSQTTLTSEQSEEKRVYGNPYSVADYNMVNPHLGTMEDFKSVVADAHRRQMRVIIDWVPRHTGLEHKWRTQHPEWYITDKRGNITESIIPDIGTNYGGTDIALLNYDNQNMKAAMIAAMKYWVIEADIDGFRIDMAHDIPNDFWSQMKTEFLKLPKEVFILADSEVAYHRNSGAFHATYGWSFYRLANDIAQGSKSVKDIKKWLKKDRKKYKKGFGLNFTSSHGKRSTTETAVERMGKAHHAMAVMAATIDGMPLLNNGQEIPLEHKISLSEKDTISWHTINYQEFYKSLFEFKGECTALRNKGGAELEFISKSNEVLAFRKQNSYDDVVVIINLTDQTQKYSLNVNFKYFRNIHTNNLVDAIAGEEREIEAWKYYVLDGSYGR